MVSRNKVNEEWLNLIQAILQKGTKELCRQYSILELIGRCTRVPMSRPVITLRGRKLGYRFMCAEAAWILSGDNRVDTIKGYSKMIENFSDDGVTFFGAYGPPIVDQLEYVIRAFKKDIFTRRAVLTIWRPKPPVKCGDVPCTVSIQFLIRIRNDKPTLYLIDNMRSSDAWLGVPYDWFNFSMIGAYVALYLNDVLDVTVELGDLILCAGSQHLYTNSFGYKLSDVFHVVDAGILKQELFEYNSFNLSEFSGPSELVEHLWLLASSKRGLKNIYWLRELEDYWEAKNGQTK